MSKYMLPCYVVTKRKSKIYDFFIIRKLVTKDTNDSWQYYYYG